YPIAILTAVDSNGVADSSGVRCSVSGLVYGGNLRAAGLQFTIHDQTGGIGVFSSSADFGYSVEEGDSVVVVGVVAQFNGFTQMESLDTVYEAGTGMLPQPVNTVVLDESTESELVRINNVSLISPVQWNNSNPSGFSVDIRQGMINFFSMRIDEQTDLFSQNAPTGTFDVIGLGGQFDNSPPFTEGYQITPRSSADVILHTAAEELVSQKAFAVYPNPGSGIFHIRLKEQTKETFTLRVADLAGRVMLKSSQASDAGYLQINLSDAAEGLYLIEITGKSFTAKSRVNVMN
ncbi:MAG TPA: T9SS type A sorting domain-containing protein, partial [Chitinophagales bacterium]|nr:T9SS type A sorting domain-containing protein [Chitinophagales bacterium]